MHIVGSTVKPFIEPMNVTLRSQHTYPGWYKIWSLPSFMPLMLLFKRLKGQRLSASVRAAISTFHWNTNEQVQLEAFILHVILIEEWAGKYLKNCPEMCKNTSFKWTLHPGQFHCSNCVFKTTRSQSQRLPSRFSMYVTFTLKTQRESYTVVSVDFSVHFLLF